MIVDLMIESTSSGQCSGDGLEEGHWWFSLCIGLVPGCIVYIEAQRRWGLLC